MTQPPLFGPGSRGGRVPPPVRDSRKPDWSRVVTKTRPRCGACVERHGEPTRAGYRYRDAEGEVTFWCEDHMREKRGG